MVQPVVLERDPDGHITGEKIGEPVALYDLDTVQAYVDELRSQVSEMNGAVNTPDEPVVSNRPAFKA